MRLRGTLGSRVARGMREFGVEGRRDGVVRALGSASLQGGAIKVVAGDANVLAVDRDGGRGAEWERPCGSCGSQESRGALVVAVDRCEAAKPSRQSMSASGSAWSRTI